MTTLVGIRGAILEIDEIKLGPTGGLGGTAQSAPAHERTEHQRRNHGLEQPQQAMVCAICTSMTYSLVAFLLQFT